MSAPPDTSPKLMRSSVDCEPDFDTEHQPSENTGLLGLENDHPKVQGDPHRRTRIKLYVAVFVSNLAFQILAPTQTRIFEQIFCQRWYSDHSTSAIPINGIIPEDQCKVPGIQRQLATLIGWYKTLDAAPAAIMAIPLGVFIDVIGRRPVVLVSMATLIAQQFWITFVTAFHGGIPLQAIWLAPLLNFLSGGLIVLNMVFFAVLTDTSSREDLAPYLFRVTAVSQSCRVFGPIIAGGLMKIDPWWAILLGLSGLLVLFAISWTVPETLVKEDGTPAPSVEGVVSTRCQRLVSLIEAGFKGLTIVFTDRRLVALVCVTPLTNIPLEDVLHIYASDRYNISLADATLISSLQGAAATVSLFLLLPLFSTFLIKRLALSPTRLNAILVRLSLAIVAVAWTLQGLAPTIAILLLGLTLETLGLGGEAAIKALAATIVDAQDVGRVYSVLAVAEVLTTVVTHPVTAWLFNIGLDKGGGIYLGFPFFLAAICAAVACLIMLMVRFHRVSHTSSISA